MPYEVCQSEASVGRWITVAPIPVPSRQEHRDERDVREARHDDGEPGDAARRRAGCARARAARSGRRSRPSRRARWSQSSASDKPRGDVCAAWPAAPGTSEHGRGRRERAGGREQLGDRALRPLGPVDPERDAGREHEEREAELEVEVAAAERRVAHERHERADVERTSAARTPPSRARGRRESRAGRAAAATTNAIETRAQARPRDAPHERPRDRDPEDEEADRAHRRRGRRASAPRRAAASRRVSRDRRDHELRRRPGFGPTANVNAPRTGWPSTEITRQ